MEFDFDTEMCLESILNEGCTDGGNGFKNNELAIGGVLNPLLPSILQEPTFSSAISELPNIPLFYDETKCVVCHQGDAADCSYYGGRKCCMSCRAFFGRSAKSGAYNNFKCYGNRNCIVDSKSRKSCKYCRFKRCREVGGMKIKFVNRKMELKDNIHIGITREELKLIKKTCEGIHEIIFEKYLDFYHSHPEHLLNMLLSIKSDMKIPFHTVRAWEYLEKSVIFPVCILQIEEIGALNSHDRRILLNKNFPQYFGLTWSSYGGDYDGNWFLYQLKRLKERFEHQMEEVNGLIQNVCIPYDYDSCPEIKYEAIYASPWASSWEIEDKHKTLRGKLWQFTRKDENSPRDPLLYTLVVLTLMFSSDEAEFQDPKTVEKLQLKYSVMLYRYLKSIMPLERARKKFAQSVLLVKDTRQFYELHTQMLPV